MVQCRCGSSIWIFNAPFAKFAITCPLRIAKELDMYHQEEESVRARLRELIASDEDYYVIKKQVCRPSSASCGCKQNSPLIDTPSMIDRKRFWGRRK